MTLKHSITCVLLSDLGVSYGFGTADLFMVKVLMERGYIEKVICRDASAELKKTKLFIPALLGGKTIPRGFSLLERTFKEKGDFNGLNRGLFDRSASAKISGNNGFLLTTPGFNKSIRKAKKLGKKVVLSVGCHPAWILQTMVVEYGTEDDSKWLPVLRRNKLLRMVESVENADYLVATSEFAKKTYVDLGFEDSKVIVNPLGVNLSKYHFIERKKTEKFRFLVVADANISKGFKYLLEAWSGLTMENAELVICGSISEDISEMVNEYKKKIQNVVFTGHINNPLEYYESCSVFVLTSVLEGMARVTLEAMSTGMPVIATPNTGCVVRDDVDGFIVAARDVEGLREKFLYFYNHQDQALVMGKNAFQRIRDYSWDAYSVRMAELFEKISGAH